MSTRAPKSHLQQLPQEASRKRNLLLHAIKGQLLVACTKQWKSRLRASAPCMQQAVAHLVSPHTLTRGTSGGSSWGTRFLSRRATCRVGATRGKHRTKVSKHTLGRWRLRRRRRVGGMDGERAGRLVETGGWVGGAEGELACSSSGAWLTCCVHVCVRWVCGGRGGGGYRAKPRGGSLVDVEEERTIHQAAYE